MTIVNFEVIGTKSLDSSVSLPLTVCVVLALAFGDVMGDVTPRG